MAKVVHLHSLGSDGTSAGLTAGRILRAMTDWKKTGPILVTIVLFAGLALAGDGVEAGLVLAAAAVALVALFARGMIRERELGQRDGS